MKIKKNVYIHCFTGGTVVENLPANAGDARIGVLSLGREDPLEKQMDTHFSILTWRIPWAEGPGELQSVGSQSQTQLSNWGHTHTDTHALPYENLSCYLYVKQV